jgi:hypothetical protein
MAAGFREGFVAADGFRIRYREAGKGPELVDLHGVGGLRLTAAHKLLSRNYRVSFEMPGFGRRLAREPEQISVTDEHARIGQAIDNELIGCKKGTAVPAPQPTFKAAPPTDRAGWIAYLSPTSCRTESARSRHFN